MAKTSIAGSASVCRKAAKRIRSKSSAHCVAKLSTRILFINCNRRRRPGACLVKSNPQLIRKWRWSHPYVLSRSPTARRDRSHLHGGGSLEQKARSLGHTIKVETQGSSGVENRLSSEEIAAADYVILATGRGLSGDDRARFAGKKVYEIAISQALKNIDQIFSELPTNSQLFAADSGVKLGKQEVQSGSVMST